MKSNKLFRKKRNFLLIEVLISLFLITIMFVPLIKNPIYFFKSQIKQIEQLECERIAENSFLEIYLKLKNQDLISLSQIPHYSTEAKSFYLEKREININNFIKKEVQRSYKISSSDNKITKENKEYKLLKIKILLKLSGKNDPYIYKYKILTASQNS
ncbi:MAG: hypothetical protein K1060chlam5_00161 [Candidatus Anoxychlamydiales bacterium]|nr:hypothetical protein [Candidatus Anoxychlamydiales bacterium]